MEADAIIAAALHNFDGINFPLIICYTTQGTTSQQLLPTTTKKIIKS